MQNLICELALYNRIVNMVYIVVNVGLFGMHWAHMIFKKCFDLNNCNYKSAMKIIFFLL